METTIYRAVMTGKEFKELEKRIEKEGGKSFGKALAYRWDKKPFDFDSFKYSKPETVEIETKCLFNNQWNTKDKRVFDCIGCYDNYDWNEIFAQWLDITPEMIQIRKDSYKCGYCGKQYCDPGKGFCSECIGNKFLKKEDLYLLRLLSINSTLKRKELTQMEFDILLPLWAKEQTETQNKLLKDKIEDFQRQIKKDYQNHKIEFKGLQWLIDNKKFQYIDNIIYYNHTETFCIGWRDPVQDQQEVLKDMKGFPYRLDTK